MKQVLHNILMIVVIIIGVFILLSPIVAKESIVGKYYLIFFGLLIMLFEAISVLVFSKPMILLFIKDVVNNIKMIIRGIIRLLPLLIITSCSVVPEKQVSFIEHNTVVQDFEAVCECSFKNKQVFKLYDYNNQNGIEYDSYGLLIVKKDQYGIVINNILYDIDNVEFSFGKDREVNHFMVSSEDVFYSVLTTSDNLFFDNLMQCIGYLNVYVNGKIEANGGT